jgi:16S rRNA (uracil1498-N3)-methyltransferase
VTVSRLPGAGAAHAFVTDLDQPELDDADRHHFERVLRLRPGTSLTIADGQGRWRVVRFGPELEPDGPIEEEPRVQPEIGVGFAVAKGDRPELVVQKLTELGVDLIQPLATDRGVVRWDGERADRHHERLVRVAREAAMQCRRASLPEVAPLAPFARIAARPGVAMATLGGQRPTLAHPFVLVGPEGGWSDGELSRALPQVGLAPYVLRSETAAIVAGALLVAARGCCT